MSSNEPTEPVASGTLAVAKQSFGDLFRWRIRATIVNEYGEKSGEWQQPPALKNPISLFAKLSLRDWLFFSVGFFAWCADAFDFHALSIQTFKV